MAETYREKCHSCGKSHAREVNPRADQVYRRFMESTKPSDYGASNVLSAINAAIGMPTEEVCQELIAWKESEAQR